MNTFILHLAFEIRAGFRNKQLLMMNLLFPLGFYLLMGFVLAEINPIFREDMIPAMIIFSTLAATLLGIPLYLTTGRENGIFRSYKIYGAPASSILVISALTTVFHSLITATVITISAPFLFDALLPENWLNFFLVFLVIIMCYASISVLIGVVSSSSRESILWSQLIFVTSILLGGIMLPNQMLPEVLGSLSKLLPATHAMNAFNSLAFGKAVVFYPWGSMIVLLAGSLFAFFLAVFLFRWDQHSPTLRGHPTMGILAVLPFAVSIFLFS
ncbi:ABC transporter permease [Chloroflexota bacterium]